MGVSTIVDPIRGVGEPIIAIDHDNNAWISGPGGSSTQTSFFWHSRDGGETYPLAGLPGGHWVCSSTGGGDSHLLIDHVNGDVYVTDQQSLVHQRLIAGSTRGTRKPRQRRDLCEIRDKAEVRRIRVVEP